MITLERQRELATVIRDDSARMIVILNTPDRGEELTEEYYELLEVLDGAICELYDEDMQ